MDVIATRAVAKYKRSTQHKEDLQAAKKAQKDKDKRVAKEKKIQQTVTKMKKHIRQLDPDGDSFFMKYGLQQLAAEVKAEKAMRGKKPKWVGLTKKDRR